MTDFKDLHEQAEELEKSLRLQSFPVGVKLLTNSDEIPKSAQRPVKDMGCHLSLCQAIALARREGLTIAQTIEDMWCFEAAIGLGFAKPPQRFLEGYHRYPQGASTLEAGRNWDQNLPRLEYGRYSAIVAAPLNKIDFRPDVFMVYAEPLKIRNLVRAKEWLDGINILPQISASSACVYSIVPVIQHNDYQVTLPCNGESSKAACDPYDMIFSASMENLPDLLRGIRDGIEKGISLPRKVDMQLEYPLNKIYLEFGKAIGMNWVKGK